MTKTRSTRRLTAHRSGFTLVEIMIVVFIISVLLNIAAPAMIGARDKSQARSCVKNLSNFMTAKEQYVMDNKIPASSTAQVTWPNIASYIHVLPGTDPVNGPKCPTQGDSYTGYYGDIKTLPTCPYGSSSATPSAVHSL